jgi:hypothetical protein
MGWRYTQFRVKHELLRETGLLKKKFPVSPSYEQYMTLEDWQRDQGNFFFKSKESLSFEKSPSALMKERFDKIRQGQFIFFNSIEFKIGEDYNWITNPDTGFEYDMKKHWTEITDYSKEAGDIKYVWEKSRFSYLYDVIRYDYHFNEDCSVFVFSEILSWIKSNPINQGPNYRCSQEISLRVLNWTFALFYYRNSVNLTDKIFKEIQFAIYWQMDHVFKNIDFSRIAVRNNHAITETLTLYLVGLLYPQFAESSEWKQKGKKWFEKEIAYQIYEDGTFLQFSMNYHRIVVQLLTWAIVLSEKNSERFSEVVYDRARKSVEFLRACMVDENGKLPNYGANDGALFFKLNDADYRDFRPSLNALAKTLKMDLQFASTEDELWFDVANKQATSYTPSYGIHTFEKGGYYIFREPGTLTFIRCGNHKDRPSQADNLHLDIWQNGQNVLYDGGSYKYNTTSELLNYFMGTGSHNTVMLNSHNQMIKGPRFTWFNWTQSVFAKTAATTDSFLFEGEIKAFSFLDKSIRHRRKIEKAKNRNLWMIEDEILNKPNGISVRQIFHPESLDDVNIVAKEKNGKEILPEIIEGYKSNYYGKKEEKHFYSFNTFSSYIKTLLIIK